MKCFIHTNSDAIAACRKCGKGMCEECSSYSGHNGICPECRRKEFIEERAQQQYCAKEKSSQMKWSIFWLILTFWTIIGLIHNLLKYFKLKKDRTQIYERIIALNKEISRLDEALKNKKGHEFI